MFILGYVSATSPTRTKMFAISISSPLHEKQWRAFLMRMILHQELIGWYILPNSTWCIAFSIERIITKCFSFCEVKSSVWIICCWISACRTCWLNFYMLMWHISYHRVQTSINGCDEWSALFNNCTFIKTNKKYYILVVFFVIIIWIIGMNNVLQSCPQHLLRLSAWNVGQVYLLICPSRQCQLQKRFQKSRRALEVKLWRALPVDSS